MSSRNITIAVVAVLVLLFGAWIFTKSNNSAQTPTVTQTQSTPTDAMSSSSAAMHDNIVTISSTGFSPATITIKAGEAVTWSNTDTALHQVNSDPHPVHTDYPPLNTVGQIPAGSKKSLTFPATGTYKYHDHLHPSFTGTVIVQ
jgi:plastocyanin